MKGRWEFCLFRASYTIFVYKKILQTWAWPQGWKTGGPKCIPKSKGFKRSFKTKPVSKIPMYTFAFPKSLHITIQLRFPEWPMAVYSQDHGKEGTWKVTISFTSASPALSTPSSIQWELNAYWVRWQQSHWDQLWEKADMGESKQEARVSIFLFYQID